MKSEQQAHNELFEKVGNLMATAKATQESVALLRSDTNQGIDRISTATPVRTRWSNQPEEN